MFIQIRFVIFGSILFLIDFFFIFLSILFILFLSTISFLYSFKLRTSLTNAVLFFINFISELSNESSLFLIIFSFFFL